MEFIIILSIYLGKEIDAYIILALLLLNAIVGFIQERKSGHAVESLKKRLQVKVRVLRDGAWSTVPSSVIVPGDVIRLRAGDFVPADVKVLGSLEVDQSSLTGESLPVEKKAGDEIFSGSIVRIGEAGGIVTRTGTKTYFGKTIQLVQTAKPRLHSEEVIARIVKILFLAVVSLLSIVILVNSFKGVSGILQILPLVSVLLVSAIPVALPAMFTITMAIGATELARKGVLITRLNATEDAASMTTLCIDKTGTLTQNKLEIADVMPFGKYEKSDILLYGFLSSNEANQDPIDNAFIEAYKKQQLISGKFKQIGFVPFNPSTRMTSATIESEGIRFGVYKGAVSTIASLCTFDMGGTEVEKRVEEFAVMGYRSIAVAIQKGLGKELVGIAALYDPPRQDSKVLVESLQRLGLSIKMLTGDSLPVAAQLAKIIGLGKVLKLSQYKLGIEASDKESVKTIENADGLAEVYPEDKFHIVKALQSSGHIVGMTGDGVNDAPALKQAEVGIAVNTATDVAKGSASAVLTSEGLTNIVDLVRTGRMVYQRIETWILNKIIKTFQTAVFIIAIFFLTGKYAVSTFDVVLLLLLVDFVTLSLSTDNVVWSNKPNRWQIKKLVRIGLVLGMATMLESLLIFYLGTTYLKIRDEGESHTFVFDILLFFGLATVLSIRERKSFWKSRPSKTLLTVISGDMVFAVFISILGVPGIQHIPILDVIVAFGSCVIFSLFINDQIKVILAKSLVKILTDKDHLETN